MAIIAIHAYSEIDICICDTYVTDILFSNNFNSFFSFICILFCNYKFIVYLCFIISFLPTIFAKLGMPLNGRNIICISSRVLVKKPAKE